MKFLKLNNLNHLIILYMLISYFNILNKKLSKIEHLGMIFDFIMIFVLDLIIIVLQFFFCVKFIILLLQFLSFMFHILL